MTEDHGWARPGSGDLPPGWSHDQPPPYEPGMPPGGGPGMPPGGGPGGPQGPGGFGGFGPPPGAPGPGGPWPPPGMRPPAPKPGIVPLRPLGLGELLDGAFTGIRRNPKATLGLAAILMTIASVAQAVVSFYFVGETTSLSARAGDQISDAEAIHLLGQVGGGMAIALVVSVIATTILTGLLTIVYGRAVLGQSLTMGEAWRQVRPRLWRLLGVTVLVILIMLVVLGIGFGVPIGIAAAVPNAGTIALAVLIGVAAIVAAVYLHVKLALAESAVVLENSGVGAALARSYRLTNRSFWRVLGILLLTNVIAGLLNGVIQTPFAAGQLPMAMSDNPTTGLELLSVVLSTIGAIISTTITTPFVAGVGVLLYVDLRMRREGLDLQLQTAATHPDEADFASLWQPAHGPGPYAPQEPPYGTDGPAPYDTGTPGPPPQDGPGQPPSPGGP